MKDNNNMPIISIGDFVEVVKEQLDEENYKPVFGLGKGGIGKSQSMAELAQELHIGYIDIRLLLYSETDLKGIPYPNVDHTKTVWLENDILPIVERDGEKGILVLDEITSASKSVRTAAYQLLNERKLGTYKLPDKWIIVCLGNGEEDGGDFEGMEANFANRCSVFNVVTSVEDWKDWAIAHGVNGDVIAYINFKQSDLHTFNPDNENEMLFSSPRSWVAVSDILNKHKFDKGDKILLQRIKGCIGNIVGNRFIAFCNCRVGTLDPYTIVNDGDMPNIQSREILAMTLQSVSNIVDRCISSDLATNGSVTSETVTKLGNALRWMVSPSVGVEMATVGIKDLIRHNKATYVSILLSPQFNSYCPQFAQFAKENREVFS